MEQKSTGKMEQYESWVEAIWGDTTNEPGKILNIMDRMVASRQGDVDAALQDAIRQIEDLRMLNICCLGLNEEAGEVTGPIKKYIRNPVKNPVNREHIIDECGDVLYYLTKILHWVDATLNDAMQANEEKINVRYAKPSDDSE